MWWFILISLAAADSMQKTLDYVNSVYKANVSGGVDDLYSLGFAAYDESMVVNGFIHQQILLLHNEVDNTLALHAFRSWEDFNGLEFQLLNHTTPEFTEDSSAAAQSLIDSAVSAFFNTSGSVSNVSRQALNVTTFNDFSESQVYNFEVVSGEVVAQGTAYKVTVYTDNFNGTNYSYYSQTVDQAVIVSVSEVSTKVLVLSLIIVSALTGMIISLGLYLYWRKTGTFFLAKKSEEVLSL